MEEATECSVSRRRAVRMSLRSEGEVRANSKAVLRPMPDDAPVMRIVLPARRLETAEAIAWVWVWVWARAWARAQKVDLSGEKAWEVG